MATTNLFLNYEWPTGLFELRCSGNFETNIWDCIYNITDGGQYCYQHNDASVFCLREFIWKKLSLTKYLLLANTTVYSNCSNGDVRLVGGSTDNEGNVQICYYNAWGSVCDDNWETSDSNVVCRQLGFQPYSNWYLHNYCSLHLINAGSQYYSNNYFALSNNPPYLYGTFSCSESEQSLMSCPRSYSSLLKCRSNEIAGVHCEGKT